MGANTKPAKRVRKDPLNWAIEDDDGKEIPTREFAHLYPEEFAMKFPT